jgi:type I restriction enzyme S subunit
LAVVITSKKCKAKPNVNQHVCIIRPSNQIYTKFLYFVLRSEIGQHQIDLSQSGSGREGLNFESLGNFIVLIPKLHEQDEIIRYIEATDCRGVILMTEIRNSIELLKERRAALITAAVTGAIPVEEMQG